ncbi:MAG: calcium/sodium antiporter [Firmicutes bacterium]|nr:calcium/sodium antiporter [Bacillota bacterium]
MTLLIKFLLLALGFLMLIKGSDYFVTGASGIAYRFGIPQIIVGLTIVAMGTSAPEAAVSITAAFKGSADITIGNIVGSNILNIWIILGAASLAASLTVAKSAVRVEMPFVIIISAVLIIMGLDGNVSRVDGIILWGIFVLYLVYLFMKAKRTREIEGEVRNYPMWKNLVFTAGGLVLIVFGSRFTVNAASDIARIFGMSERFIGLTIVAFGTSLPELFTSVSAARHGNADIAIGNIVGSNVFNILFVVGTSALIIPVPFASKFIVDGIVAAAAAVMLWLFCKKEKKINKPAGICMLVCYAAYFVYLVQRP